MTKISLTKHNFDRLAKEWYDGEFHWIEYHPPQKYELCYHNDPDLSEYQYQGVLHAGRYDLELRELEIYEDEPKEELLQDMVNDLLLNNALLLACERGKLKEAKEYLEKGADIEATDHWGYTPLHITAVYGHTETTKMLLKEGANVNATNAHGITPIYHAAAHGYIEVVKLLIKAGANIEDSERKSGVFTTMENRHIVETLERAMKEAA